MYSNVLVIGLILIAFNLLFILIINSVYGVGAESFKLQPRVNFGGFLWPRGLY